MVRVLVVTALMAMLLVAVAAPAFAAKGSGGHVDDTILGADFNGGGGGSDRGSGGGGHISGELLAAP
jgi:hypothetical protein